MLKDSFPAAFFHAAGAYIWVNYWTLLKLYQSMRRDNTTSFTVRDKV